MVHVMSGSKSSDRSFGKMFLEAKKKSVLNSWLVKLRTLPLTKPPPPQKRVSKPALSGETNGWYFGWEGRLTSPSPNYVATSHLAMVDLDFSFQITGIVSNRTVLLT